MFIKATFSGGWFFLGTFLHICVTIALCALNFMTGMTSFTTGPGANHDWTRSLQWFWTPLAMYAWDRGWADGLPLILGILWSIFVGVIVGYIMPIFRSKNHLTSASSQTKSDLAGTPWEHNPSHTSNTKKNH